MLLGLLPALHLSCLALAAIVNRTIDDAAGDSVTGRKPTFSPSTAGGYQVWQNQSCASCAIHPDLGRTFGNSYTETTFNPRMGKIAISIPFEGTAIYVFFILANHVDNPDVTTRTECNFLLNNEAAVPYLHTPDQTTNELSYNQPVYKRTNLPQREHVLDIVAEGYDYSVYINFDYAIYSYDDGASPQAPITTPAPLTSGPSGSAADGPDGATIASTLTTIVKMTTGADGQAQSITVTEYMLAETTAPSTTQDSPATGGFGGDNSTQLVTSRTPVGAIVGGVIGALAFLLAVVLVAIWCRSRRKRSLIQTQLGREMGQSDLRPKPFNLRIENSSPAIRKRDLAADRSPRSNGQDPELEEIRGQMTRIEQLLRGSWSGSTSGSGRASEAPPKYSAR